MVIDEQTSRISEEKRTKDSRLSSSPLRAPDFLQYISITLSLA
jgi:hypothetical protein